MLLVTKIGILLVSMMVHVYYLSYLHRISNVDRILMPAFSTISVRGMFDDMYDITSQLIMKWERSEISSVIWVLPHSPDGLWEYSFGPTYSIDPAADFTRLTLDAISLCAMSYRFVIHLLPLL